MPALLERPKMTRAMYEALKKHIMREREKKKQEEQEQDAMMERLKKEREMRKKKEEQDSLTMEQTKEQILTLGKKLNELQAQKHDLFSQLKKVLHQEEETRKRTQQKEQSEMTMSQPYQHTQLPAAPQPMIIHGRPALYKVTAPALAPIMQTGIKRQRSPTPPPSSTPSYQAYAHSEPKYPHTSDSKYPHAEASKYSAHGESKFAHADPKYLGPYAASAKTSAPPGHLYGAQHGQSADYKSAAYQQPSASHLYTANQSFQQQQATVAGSYPGSQSSAKYTGPTQSAFTSYQGHYAQSHPQKALAEQFPAAYSIQRMQQPSYHAGLPLPQSLEHAGQKQPGFEDKFKLGQSQIRGMVPAQQPGLITQTLQLQQQQQQQQQQSKNPGAFVGGYPARSQAAPPGANYPTSTSSGGSQGRPAYGPQSHGRYY